MPWTPWARWTEQAGPGEPGAGGGGGVGGPGFAPGRSTLGTRDGETFPTQLQGDRLVPWDELFVCSFVCLNCLSEADGRCSDQVFQEHPASKLAEEPPWSSRVGGLEFSSGNLWGWGGH